MSLQEAQQILGVEKNATLEQARKVGCSRTMTHAAGVVRTLARAKSCSASSRSYLWAVI